MNAGKVFITGAFGIVGTALVDLPGENVLFDKQIPAEFVGKPNVVQGDIQDRAFLEQSMKGCRAVVHLAASARVQSSWEDVLKNNIIGIQVVLEASKAAGVERVVFASSNHVVGMYEEDKKPNIYEPGHGIMLTKETEPRPDSLYGVSKLFGENLGRYVSEKEAGPKFYSIRIGRVFPEGHEYYQEDEKRMRAIWLSRRDLRQLVQGCLDYDGPLFDIFYGVSNNSTRWLDIEYAREQLGYLPQDNGVSLKAAAVTA
jgi:nucleoside-diphosphate-sugar epimerase